MRDLTARFRAAYAAAPWRLLLLTASFTLTGWIALRLAQEPTAGRLLLWFVGAAVAHDFVLFPIYALADCVLRAAVRAGRRRAASPCPVSPLNHIRVPALGAGLLFLVFLPDILRQGRATYLAATGQDQQPYLTRWLAISSTMFVISAAVYTIRRVRGRRPPG